MTIPKKQYTYLYSKKEEIINKANNILKKLHAVKECSLENGIYTGNGIPGSHFHLNILTNKGKWTIQPSLKSSKVRIDNITKNEYGIYFDNVDEGIKYINKQTTI